MTTEAPAAIALVTSPGVLDAAVGNDGRLAGTAAAAQSMMAVNWGTPTPATIRVVQMEPGPMPTLTADAPAAMSASVASAVATFPAMMSNRGYFFVSFRTVVTTMSECPWAVSTAMRSTPALTRASARSMVSPPTPTAAATRNLPIGSLLAFGYFIAFSMSLMVIRPFRL